MRKYFGTDGVRGTVGQSPMTPDFVLRLGYAAGKVLSGQGKHPAVLIGKDTRISGYMIESALEAGFSAAGIDVHMCGPMPTPAVAYLTRALRLTAGVVISASHNPYPDNGIKFFSGDGFKLPDATEAAIEAAMEQPMGCNAASNLGKVWRVDDAPRALHRVLQVDLPDAARPEGPEARGRLRATAPPTTSRRTCSTSSARTWSSIGVKPDGFNINEKMGDLAGRGAEARTPTSASRSTATPTAC